MKCIFILLVAASLVQAQTLNTVSSWSQNRVLIEAKILNSSGVQLSGLPSVRSKFCPNPEGTSQPGLTTLTCDVDKLSYSGTDIAESDAQSRTSVSSTRVYHSWSHNAKADSQSSNKAIAGSHVGNYAKKVSNVTGGANYYQVKSTIRIRIKNPVNRQQLDASDLYDLQQRLYAGPYNNVKVEWTDDKWKLTGYLTNAQNTATPVNETVNPTGTYLDKTYVAYKIVANGQNFEHNVILNAVPSSGTDWKTKYGFQLEQQGTGEVVEDLQATGLGYVRIDTITNWP